MPDQSLELFNLEVDDAAAAPVKVIGGGLAGCECAWQLARRGIPVSLYEMRPQRMTPAHTTANLAELVCSNSLRSDDINSAVGLLHEEMRRSDSLIMAAADLAAVPAGGALAVDRELFSGFIEKQLEETGLVQLIREEVERIEPAAGQVIIATGPLTHGALAAEIQRLTGNQAPLAFFDAIAPIVYEDSIDHGVVWRQSRYDKGDSSDYLNCPLTQEQYYAFVDALLAAETGDFKQWEKDTPYFNGCLPIEEMARRGRDTLRFGPMKPVGLTDPQTGRRPYAVVQLRQDNRSGTLYNIVGFQTKIRYGQQSEVLRMIPGLEQAVFARMGGIHRNTFINSPQLLSENLELRQHPRIRFAGQITGVEGYVESAALGLLAGVFTSRSRCGLRQIAPPRNSALGSLLAHITGEANPETFQPMNINYGLFPPLECVKSMKKAEYARISLLEIEKWQRQLVSMAEE